VVGAGGGAGGGGVGGGARTYIPDRMRDLARGGKKMKIRKPRSGVRRRLKVGDLVVVRGTTAPRMVVGIVAEIRGMKTADCAWINAAGGRERRSFRLADLERAAGGES
jgi:hypothetical protein